MNTNKSNVDANKSQGNDIKITSQGMDIAMNKNDIKIT